MGVRSLGRSSVGRPHKARGWWKITGVALAFLMVTAACTSDTGTTIPPPEPQPEPAEATTTEPAEATTTEPAEATTTEPADTTTAQSDPVTLTTVLAWGEGQLLDAGYLMFLEELQAEAPWITVDIRGGPEAIPPIEIPGAVSDGTIDMGSIPSAWAEGLVPSVFGNLLSPGTPWEEREAGVYDFFQERHADVNLHYFGQTYHVVPARFFLNTSIDSADFTGLQIRVTPAYDAVVTELGGTSVFISPGETYSALERGVVDGLGWTSQGFDALGFDEVVSYELDEDFFTGAQILYINLETWNSLDATTQEVMTRVMEDTERLIADFYADQIDEESQRRRDAGIELITLSDEESQKFQDAAYSAGWAKMMEIDPNAAEELMSLYDSMG